MSYSTDPVRDAARHLDNEWETAFDRRQAVTRAETAFLQMTKRPMKEPTMLGDPRCDYAFDADKNFIRTPRHSTVGELIYDQLDYPDGPDHDDVLTLLQRAAAGENIKDEAQELFVQLSRVYAHFTVSA